LFPVGRARSAPAAPGQMVGRQGRKIGQPWAMTCGNLSNETVEAAGEVATSTVASPHLTDQVQSINRLSKNIAVSIGQVEVDARLIELKELCILGKSQNSLEILHITNTIGYT
ncbi:hypothetical protein GOODEAATRI_002491, partial [Goodea atripinnis]